MNALITLSASDLAALRDALRTGRLAAPYLPTLVERIIPGDGGEVAAALQAIAGTGANHQGVVAAVDLLAQARAGLPAADDTLDLVTTGPDASGTTRDTLVVVQELFRNAAQSVLVAGYELYQAEPLFRALADRMAAEPGLHVRMFLNIKRAAGDTTTDRELIAGFCHRFRIKHWPTGRPLPEVYFDPRSISIDPRCRAVLHAKCVVIDQQEAFVSSANFTEAAQERNIEVGLLARQNRIAERLVGFFESMLAMGHLKRVL